MTSERLEHALDLPLGTVLVSSTGVRHIFIGCEKNKAGHTYVFHPEVGLFQYPMVFCCSFMEGGLKKFPALEQYRKGTS
jgi:hypothetical protein